MLLIQNKILDKLTTIEHKLNWIQQKMVEFETKLNQLEREKELRDKMVQKTNLLVFQLDRQQEVLFKIADEFEINVEDNDYLPWILRIKNCPR